MCQHLQLWCAKPFGACHLGGFSIAQDACSQHCSCVPHSQEERFHPHSEKVMWTSGQGRRSSSQHLRLSMPPGTVATETLSATFAALSLSTVQCAAVHVKAPARNCEGIYRTLVRTALANAAKGRPLSDFIEDISRLDIDGVDVRSLLSLAVQSLCFHPLISHPLLQATTHKHEYAKTSKVHRHR